MLLNELTKVTRAFNLDKGNHNAILVRAGAGQFVCWVPGKHADDAVSEVAELPTKIREIGAPWSVGTGASRGHRLVKRR